MLLQRLAFLISEAKNLADRGLVHPMRCLFCLFGVGTVVWNHRQLFELIKKQTTLAGWSVVEIGLYRSLVSWFLRSSLWQ